MTPIGILVLKTDENDDQVFCIVNPERAYLVVPPDQVPDDMMAMMQGIKDDPSLEPLGVIVDAGQV